MTNLERFTRTINWEIPDRLMTYDRLDNRALLEQFGGEGDLIERNARMASRIGLDVTRRIQDPDHHWMNDKVKNWIRFLGAPPEGWEVTEGGGTAWLSKRPFHDLKGLEKNMPRMPRKDEVAEWYKPRIKAIKEVYDAFDVVFIGAMEGPISDSFTYMDMTLFCEAIYDAPEPWGPWTTAFTTEAWDVGPGETSSFPTKWMSPDGKTLYLVFSGNDDFAARKAILTLW